MLPVKTIYYERIVVPESEEFIGNAAEVYSDAEGYFITIDGDESLVMLTLPCAIRVHEALGRVIAAAQAKRKRLS